MSRGTGRGQGVDGLVLSDTLRHINLSEVTLEVGVLCGPINLSERRVCYLL